MEIVRTANELRKVKRHLSQAVSDARIDDGHVAAHARCNRTCETKGETHEQNIQKTAKRNKASQTSN